MAEFTAKRDPTRRPAHPGRILADDVLPATAKSKSEIARLLGISRHTLFDILDGKQPVTPQMALRLGKLCGNSPHLWLSMQVTHDLWEAKQKVDVSGIPTLKVA